MTSPHFLGIIYHQTHSGRDLFSLTRPIMQYPINITLGTIVEDNNENDRIYLDCPILYKRQDALGSLTQKTENTTNHCE